MPSHTACLCAYDARLRPTDYRGQGWRIGFRFVQILISEVSLFLSACADIAGIWLDRREEELSDYSLMTSILQLTVPRNSFYTQAHRCLFLSYSVFSFDCCPFFFSLCSLSYPSCSDS
jgi:hypothetical protein